MIKFSTIILAAGNGKRFRSNTSKILHKIGNAPLFFHIIKTALKIESREIILVTDESYKTINYTKDFTNVKEVYQVEKLGSGHALQIAYPKISHDSEYVFLLYGDSPLITNTTLEKSIKEITKDKSIGIGIISVERDSENSYGSLIIDANGNIEAILEKGVNNTYKGYISKYCNSGLLIKKEILDQHLMSLQMNKIKNEILATDLINISFKNGYKNIIIKGDKEELIGINTRQELVNAEKIFQTRMRNYFLDNGVTLIDPCTVYFSHDTKIQQDTIIYPNVFFGEQISIGENNIIYPFSYIEQITTENHVEIGPFARIRGKSHIAQNSAIGNFVELKNSTVGEQTKIKHLSYIGDAKIGNKCNIGAGSIICNYDGVSKFNTLVHDNVFIGSNTTIIAPLEIESNALIGAGSVITKNVKKSEIAISRIDQKNIENGATKYFKKRKIKK